MNGLTVYEEFSTPNTYAHMRWIPRPAFFTHIQTSVEFRFNHHKVFLSIPGVARYCRVMAGQTYVHMWERRRGCICIYIKAKLMDFFPRFGIVHALGNSVI